MNEWILKITKDAFKDFDKLQKSVKNDVKNKLIWFRNNFDFVVHLPLKGELKGFFKMRIGDYRVIYEIDWERKIIYILRIAHRKDIYKIFKLNFILVHLVGSIIIGMVSFILKI